MALLLQGHTRSEENHRSPQCLDLEASLTDRESKRGGRLQAKQSSGAGKAPTAQLASIPVPAAGCPYSWSGAPEDRCLTTSVSS